MERYPVIDVDGHVEPGMAVDWKRYMPGPYGETFAEYAVRKHMSIVNTFRTPKGLWDPKGIVGTADAPHYSVSSTRRGAWDSTARLADMDAEGIDVAVLFGSSIGFRTDTVPAPIVEGCRGYNNWLHDYCRADPKRLKGVAQLPLHDMEPAVQELRRTVRDLGFAGPALPCNFQNRGLDDPYFDPIYAEAERLDVPVLVHISPYVSETIGRQLKYAFVREHTLRNPLAQMLSTMEVLFGGVLERFSKVRIAFLEGCAGWLPFWLWRLDEEYEKQPHEMPLLTKKPSDYWRDGRLFISCEADESTLADTVSAMGDRVVVFSSDYPHWDCLYPRSVQALRGQKGLSEAQQRNILCDNAVRLLHGEA